MQGGGLRRGKSGRKRMTKVEAEGDLSPQQKQFCYQYIATFNPGQSYLDAGYKAKTFKQASSAANGLMKRQKIHRFIEELLKIRRKTMRKTADELIARLEEIAFTNLTDVVNEDGSVKPFNQLKAENLAALQEINVEESDIKSKRSAKLKDGLKSLELLCRINGLTSDLNQSVACIQSYGINLKQTADGQWIVES